MAFQELKSILHITSIVDPSKRKGGPTLYLSASNAIVSSALVRSDDQGTHHPIYYTTKELTKIEKGYTEMEQLKYALITMKRSTKPYLRG